MRNNGQLAKAYLTAGQALIKLKYQDIAELKIGRQLQDSLLLKSTNTRAVPDIYSGVSARVKPLTGVTLPFVAEMLGITEAFTAVDELKLADDDSFTVLERIEGGPYLSSTCAGLPAAVGWATGSLPEPPNNPQVGMMNMRGVMPALMKAPAANVGVGGIAYGKVEVPRAKRDTVVKKDMSAAEIAQELVDWIKA